MFGPVRMMNSLESAEAQLLILEPHATLRLTFAHLVIIRDELDVILHFKTRMSSSPHNHVAGA
jgi:hypothetical protein